MVSTCFVIVKYNHTKQVDGELTIKKNERLRLLDDSKNWWQVVNCNNEVGFVPSNFVRKETVMTDANATIMNYEKPYTEVRQEEVAQCSNAAPGSRPISNSSKSLNSSNSSNSSRVTQISSKAVVQFSYERKLQDEISLAIGESITVLEKSSDGWWRGESRGATGWFPSNYVEEIMETTQTSSFVPLPNSAQISANQPPKVAAKSVLENVVALYSFNATCDEELSVSKDERLTVVDHPSHDPLWVLARNSQGSEGLVPKNYIQVIGNTAPVSHASCGEMPYDSWYFGQMSGVEADRLLLRAREGEFLVRESESNPGALSIAVRFTPRNKHFKVQSIGNQLHIGNRKFDSMKDLIAHYQNSPIFSNGSERLFLVRPLTN